MNSQTKKETAHPAEEVSPRLESLKEIRLALGKAAEEVESRLDKALKVEKKAPPQSAKGLSVQIKEAKPVLDVMPEPIEFLEILPQVNNEGSIDFSCEHLQFGYQNYDAPKLVSKAGIVNFAALYSDVIGTNAMDVVKRLRSGNYTRASKPNAGRHK